MVFTSLRKTYENTREIEGKERGRSDREIRASGNDVLMS
jgi:hypothetical protein